MAREDVNLEKRRERSRKWKAANRERVRQYAQTYREANRERLREYSRGYYAASQDKLRDYSRNYREANRDQVLARNRAAYAADSERRRERARQGNASIRAAVLDHYGRTCACCGTADRPTIDHVNGGGKEHRKAVGNGAVMYRWLVANGFPPGFQTLSRRCNSSKADGRRCRINHIKAA